MEPLHLLMNRLALDLRVPVTRVAGVVHERRGIIPDTALPLARYFNTSAAFWLNLQSAYHLEVAATSALAHDGKGSPSCLVRGGPYRLIIPNRSVPVSPSSRMLKSSVSG
jgi:addiction module HigA family antidote